MKLNSLFALLLVVCFVSCRSNESAIVKPLREAGLPDPATATDQELHDWMVAHRDHAPSVASQCQKEHPEPTEQWKSTPEGRLCSIAVEVSTFAPIHVDGSGKKY